MKGFFKNVINADPKSEESPVTTSQPETKETSPFGSFFSNTARFIDTVQSKKDGLINDLSNKINSIKMSDEPTKSGKKRAKRRGDGDDVSGEDSSASEYGDEGDNPMYTEGAPVERQLSVGSVESMSEEDTMRLREDIRSIIRQIFSDKYVFYAHVLLRLAFIEIFGVIIFLVQCNFKDK